ncbi:hypothetical protein FKM82_028672 [Ascaphus truei]
MMWGGMGCIGWIIVGDTAQMIGMLQCVVLPSSSAPPSLPLSQPLCMTSGSCFYYPSRVLSPLTLIFMTPHPFRLLSLSWIFTDLLFQSQQRPME